MIEAIQIALGVANLVVLLLVWRKMN